MPRIRIGSTVLYFITGFINSDDVIQATVLEALDDETLRLEIILSDGPMEVVCCRALHPRPGNTWDFIA